jgi:hypothetical protein
MAKKMLTSGAQDVIRNRQQHCSITLSRPLYLLNGRQSRRSVLQRLQGVPRRDRSRSTKIPPTLFRVPPPLQVAVILPLSHLRLTLQCRWRCQARNEGGHIFHMSRMLIWIKIRVILVGTSPVHVCLHGIIQKSRKYSLKSHGPALFDSLGSA